MEHDNRKGVERKYEKCLSYPQMISNRVMTLCYHETKRDKIMVQATCNIITYNKSIRK